MKKLLALVLALVMSMSLVTISNAAYADAADVDYSEAVDVLSKVGVFAGGDGNKFNPKEELTREQAAKIIAYLDLGEKTAEGLVGTNTFSDVPATRWSAGYIAYCAQAGYVSGIGNGKFDPQGKLTGLQFAKMLLCALGYDAAKETLEGADWSINTAKLASTNDLFDKISKKGTEVLTREEAAQLALNALKADTYEYAIEGTTVKGDGFEVITGSSKADKVTTKKDYNGDKDNIQQLTEKLYGNDLKADENVSDDFGRPATKWTYKTEEVGTYADAADYTLNNKVTKKALYDTLGKDVVDDLKDTKNTKATLTVYVDGNDDKAYALSGDTAIKTFIDKNSTKAAAGTGNGALTEVYVDDDTNEVTVVVINTYVMQATGDYNSKKEELKVEFLAPAAKAVSGLSSDDKTLSVDDFAVIADAKEDDYLLVTIAGTDIKTVVPAKTVTGKVTAYSTGNDVTIGGTTYKYANTIEAEDKNGKKVEFSIGDEATVVLDTNGFIVYVDEAKASSSQYVFVTEFAKDGNFKDADLLAKAYFTDGTYKKVTVKNDDDIKKLGDAANNHWYSYTEKKGGEYELTLIKDGKDGFEKVYVSGKDTTLIENGKTKLGDSSFKANKSTTFVFLDDGDVKVYEGISKVPTVKTSAKAASLTAYVKLDGSTYAEYVFVEVTDATTKGGNKTNSDLIYVLDFDRTGTDADDNTYYQFNAIVNGEETKVKFNDDENYSKTASSYEFTLLENISYESETGYISDFDQVTKSDDDYLTKSFTGKVTYSDGVVNFVPDNALADKYTIYLIADVNTGINENDKDYSVDTVTGSGLETECKGYSVTDGSYVAVLDNDEITELYVYIHTTAKA